MRWGSCWQAKEVPVGTCSKDFIDCNEDGSLDDYSKNKLDSVKKDLKDGSVILEETLEKLYLNLKNSLSNEDIKTLKDFIDDFEYSKALDILEKLDV